MVLTQQRFLKETSVLVYRGATNLDQNLNIYKHIKGNPGLSRRVLDFYFYTKWEKKIDLEEAKRRKLMWYAPH